MSIPVVQTYRIARYILEQKLKGNKRYPLVLMLEPLFQCNLACSGCGKIDYPDEILRKRMSRRGRAARRRRVRRARRLDSRRRAADPQGDAADRRGHHRAQEIRLSVHERAAARAEARSVHAVAVPDVLDPLGRQQRSPRRVRVPRRHVRQGRVRDQGGARARLPRHGELHAVCRRGSRGRRELLRLHE